MRAISRIVVNCCTPLIVVLTPTFGHCAEERGPLTPSVVTEADAEGLARETGGDPAKIRESIAKGYLRAAYRDSDIRKLFPEIGAGDQRAFQCQTSATSQPSLRLSYVANARATNAVDVKVLSCTESEKGMFCSLEHSAAYYLRDPKDYFYVDNVDVAEALRAAELYARKLPPPAAASTGLPLSYVRRVGDAYELTLGRAGCACVGKRVVALRTFLWLSWLVFLDEPSVRCS
ncbi:MAG TPA: hypothetical protein VMU03_17160 [Gammaproteobacteria bacterium]|nr:hypothetical protein [Gammaproteobacteria bacterium]